jgi:hypothetical protein
MSSAQPAAAWNNTRMHMAMRADPLLRSQVMLHAMLRALTLAPAG